MPQRLIFLVVWLGMAFGSPAQQRLSLSSVDANTYASFLAGDWDQVIDLGKKALEADFDFYYLRIRMGIAYYEKQNYHGAIPHLEKAYQTNSGELDLLEYLYYAYIFSGRDKEAKILASEMGRKRRSQIGAEELQFFEQLDLGVNRFLIADKSVIDQFPAQIENGDNGSQFFPTSLYYGFLGLKHNINPMLSLYHGYSGMQVTNFQHTQKEGEVFRNPELNSRLHQYYFSLNLRIAKNLHLTGGLHWVNTRYPEMVESSRPGRPLGKYTVTIVKNERVYFMSLYKDMRYFTMGASFYYGNLNNATQYQSDLKVVFNPFGNSHLYTISTASHQSQFSAEETRKNNIILDQQLGVKVTENLWLEVYGTFGEMQNFLLNEGIVVFNGLNTIQQRYGGRMIYFIHSRWKISLDYSNLKMSSNFTTEPPGSRTFNTLSNKNHSVTGILSWRF